MKLYCLKKVQQLPVSQNKAWQFFSNPINLSEITPPWLRFRLAETVPDSIYAGLLVSYRLKPMFSIPVTWISEITHVSEPDFFVDEQRFGPYRFWQHKHFFEATDNGTQVIDIVHYSLGFGFIGQLVHHLLVRKRLGDIFDYRKEKLKRIFGEQSENDVYQ
jgi:ligand-binding SRPBCC domain-containing protein